MVETYILNLTDWRSSLLFTGLIFYAFFSHGQEISYSYKMYGTEDGLASSEVYSVIEDRRGYLWFGTDAGLSRFNGYAFKNYTVADGLVDNTIFNLHEDEQGRIWCMGFRNGICYVENDSVHEYAFNEELNAKIRDLGWVSGIAVSKDGTLNLDISPWGQGEVSPEGDIRIHGGPGEDTLTHLIFRESGIFTQLSCNYLSDKKWQIALPPNYIRKADPQKDGIPLHAYSMEVRKGINFFVAGNLLGYMDKDTIMQLSCPDSPSTINLDQRNRVWVAYPNKGIEIYETLFDLFEGKAPVRTILDGFNVSQILNQGENGMWLSVENRGVCHIFNHSIENYLYGLKKPTEITSMTKNAANEIYVSTAGGEIYAVDTAGSMSLFFKGYKDPTHMRFKESGELYISTFDNTRSRFKSPIPSEITYLCGRNFLLIDDETRWEINGRCAMKLEGKNQVYKTPGYLFFKAIHQDSTGAIWLAGNNGLFKVENDTLVLYNEALGFEEGRLKVNQIRGLKDGGMMLTTRENGLIFFYPYSLEKSWRIPLTNDILEDVYLDDENNLWIASNDGIIFMRKKAGGGFVQYRVNHTNGLPSGKINCIDGNGTHVFAGTNNGLVKLNKSSILSLEIPPKLYLDAISVNGKKIKKENAYHFNYNENNIEFSYWGLAHNYSGNIKYRYKMEGADEIWQYTDLLEVRYPSLQPGDYTFTLAASNGRGVWSESMNVSFTISPPWWKTNWFLTIVAFFSLGIFYLIHFRREKRKARQYEESRQIEEAKRRLTEAKLIALRAQINPHFTFNVLAAIQNVMVNSSVKEAVTYMNSFSVLIRKILERSEDMYISVDDEIEMLKLYINLENLRLNNTINVSFEFDPNVQLDFIEIPSMIIQPFVENAILHGLAPKKTGRRDLTISFEVNDDMIFCSVEDSGIGRERSAEIARQSGLGHHSLGVKITDERIKLYNTNVREGFSYEIIDCYDENKNPSGTKVEITFRKKKYDTQNEKHL